MCSRVRNELTTTLSICISVSLLPGHMLLMIVIHLESSAASANASTVIAVLHVICMALLFNADQ